MGVVVIGLSCQSAVSDDKRGVEPIFASDEGKSAEDLGRSIHAALSAGDLRGLLKLTAPPSVAKCDRKLFPDFVTNWTARKRKGALQSVGKVTDVSKLGAGKAHEYTECIAQRPLTVGQILLFMEPLGQGPLTKTIFSPFWIVKVGDDASPERGWYLADRLAY